MYYSNKGDFDSYNKNYEILKEKYPDYLITRIAVTYTIGEDAIWNVMQTDEKAALASLNSIMKMCDDKKKTEEYTIGLFDDLLKKYKTKIIKIRYATNDIVEVSMEILIPDITKSFDNYMQLMSEDDIFNERKLAEMSKLPKEEFEDIIIEKIFDNMTKSFKNIDGYTSVKGTIYLEKDNGKWGVAELDEKVRNFG